MIQDISIIHVLTATHSLIDIARMIPSDKWGGGIGHREFHQYMMTNVGDKFKMELLFVQSTITIGLITLPEVCF